MFIQISDFPEVSVSSICHEINDLANPWEITQRQTPTYIINNHYDCEQLHSADTWVRNVTVKHPGVITTVSEECLHLSWLSSSLLFDTLPCRLNLSLRLISWGWGILPSLSSPFLLRTPSSPFLMSSLDTVSLMGPLKASEESCDAWKESSTWSHLIVLSHWPFGTLWYCSHFTERKIEALKGEVTTQILTADKWQSWDLNSSLSWLQYSFCLKFACSKWSGDDLGLGLCPTPSAGPDCALWLVFSLHINDVVVNRGFYYQRLLFHCKQAWRGNASYYFHWVGWFQTWETYSIFP